MTDSINQEEIEERFDALDPRVQEQYIAQVETWLEEKPPQIQPGEGGATFILRCQEEQKNRQIVIRQRALQAYAESLKPPKGQKLLDLMAEGSGERVAAAEAAKAKLAEEKLKREQAARDAQRREWRGGSKNDGGFR